MLEYLETGRLARPRRQWQRGAAGSLVAHALLIALLFWTGKGLSPLLVGSGEREGVGTGPGRGAAGGGGGGSQEVIRFIDVTPPAATPAPEPVPVPVVPDPEIPPVELPRPEPAVTPPAQEPAVSAAAPSAPIAGGGVVGQGTGIGPGIGPGQGPGALGGSGGGTGGGIGSGVGPGTGGGAGNSGIRPPTPVSVILPPTPPRAVRGKTVVLRLTVDALGVVKGAEVTTSTGDRGFDNRLRRTAMDWRFNPAREPTGRTVAAQVDITFGF